MKLTNQFIIVVPTYNAEELIQQCLGSILMQTFDDIGIIVRNDMSTDSTDMKIRELLGITLKDDHSKIQFKRRFNSIDVIYINNTIKMYPAGNTYDSVMNYVDNPEAVIGVVDGDDRLISTRAVSLIYDKYESGDKWMVWSKYRSSTGAPSQSKALPSDEEIYSGRNYWSVSHFRTTKIGLFKRLDPLDVMDPFVEDSYMRYCGDAAFLFPFCEMCGNERSLFLDEELYLYNDDLPSNEHNKNSNEAIKYGTCIRQYGKRYQKITSERL